MSKRSTESALAERRALLAKYLQNHSVRMRSVYAAIKNARAIGSIYFLRGPGVTSSGPHALKEYIALSSQLRIVTAVCSRLSTPHPCCISPQTLIRTNRTHVHVEEYRVEVFLRVGACEQRSERDPRTDTFYSDVPSRARCFIRWTARAMFSFNLAFVSL